MGIGKWKTRIAACSRFLVVVALFVLLAVVTLGTCRALRVVNRTGSRPLMWRGAINATRALIVMKGGVGNDAHVDSRHVLRPLVREPRVQARKRSAPHSRYCVRVR
jgi:hypothetical protein